MTGAGGRTESDELVRRLRAAGCVFAEDEARVLRAAARTAAELAAMTERRIAGHPLEHVVGRVEFAGRTIAVAPGVFVPRRRTEFLVAMAAALTGPDAIVVDLCCGSGALGLAVADRLPGVELHAVDIDPVAVDCARGNLGDRGTGYVGDLFEPLPGRLRGRIDTLLANVPYVPTERIRTLPAEAREHEPRLTLDGGPDGLDVARRVLAVAPGWLADRGTLLFEVAVDQVAPALEVVRRSGSIGRVEQDDDIGATVIIARPSVAGD